MQRVLPMTDDLASGHGGGTLVEGAKIRSDLASARPNRVRMNQTQIHIVLNCAEGGRSGHRSIRARLIQAEKPER